MALTWDVSELALRTKLMADNKLWISVSIACRVFASRKSVSWIILLALLTSGLSPEYSSSKTRNTSDMGAPEVFDYDKVLWNAIVRSVCAIFEIAISFVCDKS